MGKIKKRAGFTLIEVIVAMAILMVVILALVSSYYSYYNSVKQMTYRAIGQNLAEVMLEETRSLQVTILDSLVKGGQYPSEPSWKKYDHYTDDPLIYEESTDFASDIPEGIPYPIDKNPDSTVYDSGEYPTYEIDSSLRLEGIETVFGLEDTGFSPSAWDDIMNSPSYKNLPSSIVVTPVRHYDGTTESYDYTILLNKETFPNYFRRIKITDLTPNVVGGSPMKLYKIEVTIYWNIGGIEQSVTVTGEKSYTP
jgi:prepilin-type N-terminal cleavage/methylation domain-containing protein